MLGKVRIFDAGHSKEIFDRCSPTEEAGQAIRSEAARKILKAIDKHSREFVERDEQVRRIQDTVERYIAAQRLHIDYLFTMGVQYRDREFLRELVEASIVKGHLSPQQIESIAKDRGVLHEYL